MVQIARIGFYPDHEVSSGVYMDDSFDHCANAALAKFQADFPSRRILNVNIENKGGARYPRLVVVYVE